MVMGKLLNMLVWLAIAILVFGGIYLAYRIIKAGITSALDKRREKKEYRKMYGDEWREKYESHLRNQRELRRQSRADEEFRALRQRTAEEFRSKMAQGSSTYPSKKYTPAIAPVEYNLYPTVNGPIQNALLIGSPKYGREWFNKNNQYWRVRDEQVRANPAVHGTPGVGLNESGFGAGRIRSGQLGEMNLAKMMLTWGLMDGGIQTFWSMRLPESKYDTDVDAIMVYRDIVYLIDAKNYSVGDSDDEAYVLDKSDPNQERLVRMHANGEIVDGSRHQLSQSMIMAVDKYTSYLRKLVPEVKVVPVVLMCPGKNGTPAVAPSLVMMGGRMPVMSAPDFLIALRKEMDSTCGGDLTADPRLVSALVPLVKGGDSKPVTTSASTSPVSSINAVPVANADVTAQWKPPVPVQVPSGAGRTIPLYNGGSTPSRYNGGRPVASPVTQSAGPAVSFHYDD